MQKLEIIGYFSCKQFDGFLTSTINELKMLEDLILQFEFFQEITISKEFITWASNKKHLKFVNFSIGTISRGCEETPLILPASFKNILDGIEAIENLQHLALSIGYEKKSFIIQNDKPGVSILRKFTTSQDKSLLSKFIQKIKAKKLLIEVGSGYISDAELRRIIGVLRTKEDLGVFGFNGEMSKISKNAYYDLDEFLDEMKENKKFKRLYFNNQRNKGIQTQLWDYELI